MLRTGTLAFLGGVVLLQQLPHLPSLWLLILAPLFILWVFRSRVLWFRVLLCFALGFQWACLQGNLLIKQQLPVAYIGKDIVVKGYIASIPQKRDHHVRFDFEIRQWIKPENTTKVSRVRLKWYGYRGPPLEPGDLMALTIRLKPPRNFYNPGSFDYAGWLWQKKILATGYVRNKSHNAHIRKVKTKFALESFRHTLGHLLKNALKDYPLGPVIRGLVLGDRSDMRTKDWELLNRTGTVHLMAISGLHIGLVAGLAFVLFRFLWARSSILCTKLAAPRAAAVFAWGMALAYAALAGFSIPTQRAVLMLAVVLFAIATLRKTRGSNVLAFSLLLIVLHDPFSVMSAGFWLSFFAVALIYYLLATANRNEFRLKSWTRLQIYISIGILPLLVLFFQQAPILSPLTNLIAIPWVTIAVIPSALFSTLMLSINPEVGLFCFQIVHYLLEGLWWMLLWFSEQPFSVMHLPRPGYVQLLLGIAGLLLLFLPSGVPARWLGLVLCLPIVFTVPAKPDMSEFNLTVLDVGQGLSVVVQTRNHILVFDTGPRFSQHFDTGKAVVHPFLQTLGVRRIDRLVISHADNDHKGGLTSLVRLQKTDSLSSSISLNIDGLQSSRCRAGQSWQWDGVIFEFLYPATQNYQSGLSENDLSCVLLIKSAKHQVLLTGDIEKPAEAILSTKYGEKLLSTILVVPHHGSKTSSSHELLDAVKPKIAVFPVGWRNKFRFPHAEVLERYKNRGVTIYSTAEHGAIKIKVKNDLEISIHKQLGKRYWHH